MIWLYAMRDCLPGNYSRLILPFLENLRPNLALPACFDRCRGERQLGKPSRKLGEY